MRLLIAFALCAASLLAAPEYSGRRPPGFALYDSQFKFHDPQDYRGKILLIDFDADHLPALRHPHGHP